jgi:peroxiredoxin
VNGRGPRSGDTVVVEGNHYFPMESVYDRVLHRTRMKSSCPWEGASLTHGPVVGEQVGLCLPLPAVGGVAPITARAPRAVAVAVSPHGMTELTPGNGGHRRGPFPCMTLTPSSTAPALSLSLTGGGSTDDLALGTGADGRFTMLVFFRGLHCPVCRAQLSELDLRRDDVTAAGVGRVVAISMETQQRSEDLVEKWDLDTLAVAHGLSEDAARTWGLFLSTGLNEHEPALFNEPGIVVLDADDTVYWTSVSSMPFARPPLDDVLGGLSFVQQKDYPARGTA